MSARTQIQRFAGWLAQNLRQKSALLVVKILCKREFSSLICAKPLYMVKERGHKIVEVALGKGRL